MPNMAAIIKQHNAIILRKAHPATKDDTISRKTCKPSRPITTKGIHRPHSYDLQTAVQRPPAVNAAQEIPAQHGPLEARLVAQGEERELQHQVVSAQESCCLPEHHKEVQLVSGREGSNHQG